MLHFTHVQNNRERKVLHRESSTGIHSHFFFIHYLNAYTFVLHVNKPRPSKFVTHTKIEDIFNITAITALRFQVTEIARLSIIVGLPEDNYPSEEQMFFALAQVMQNMRKFKLYCSEKAKFGQKIKWRWSKTGTLESLANLGPLQGLVDMSDEEV